MKKILISIVKYCRPVYYLYYHIGTLGLKLLKLFLKTDPKSILFISFGGKKYDDSPKVIYKAMLEDERYKDYNFVWAFNNPDLFEIDKGRKIKTDTLTYFKTAIKARCWITNSSVERGLGFTGKKTFFLNTWHGTPIKKMGIDMKDDNKSFRSKNTWNMDVLTSQSKYEADIFSRAFEVKREKCLICGLPRNDELAFVTGEKQRKAKEELGLPLNKKIILYAPTFREYEKNENLACVFKAPVDFNKWKEKLGDEYVVILRAHYEAIQEMNIEENDFVFDFSTYPNLNKLMIASDILLSDYSSIFFDYSILNKPMVCFTYDYEQYENERGMYFDIRDYLEGGSITENELLDLLKNLSVEHNIELVKNFRENFVESYGNAADTCINTIWNNIK